MPKVSKKKSFFTIFLLITLIEFIFWGVIIFPEISIFYHNPIVLLEIIKLPFSLLQTLILMNGIFTVWLIIQAYLVIKYRKLENRAYALFFTGLSFNLITAFLFLFFASFGYTSMSEIANYQAIYASKWDTYVDTKAGISYQYPANSWLKVYPSGWSQLAFSPVKPTSILSDEHQLYGLEFGKPNSKQDIQWFYEQSGMEQKQVKINGISYVLFKRPDNEKEDFTHSRYEYIIPNNQQYVIAVLTPTDFTNRVSTNQLFLKVVESIKPL